MSTTTRSKNLLLIIAVLLITNISVLAYFLCFKENRKPDEQKDRAGGMVEVMQKTVGFNDEQLTQYKQLKEKQREEIRPMFESMKRSKDSLFRLLGDPTTSDSVASQYADMIAQKQKMLDLQAYSYFKKIRTICTAEQQPKYDSLVLSMVSKMGSRPPRPAEDKKK